MKQKPENTITTSNVTATIHEEKKEPEKKRPGRPKRRE
jgi:hypothetical protein